MCAGPERWPTTSPTGSSRSCESADGRRRCTAYDKFHTDPAWHDMRFHVLRHRRRPRRLAQTGWTGLVADAAPPSLGGATGGRNQGPAHTSGGRRDEPTSSLGRCSGASDAVLRRNSSRSHPCRRLSARESPPGWVRWWWCQHRRPSAPGRCDRDQWSRWWISPPAAVAALVAARYRWMTARACAVRCCVSDGRRPGRGVWPGDHPHDAGIAGWPAGGLAAGPTAGICRSHALLAAGVGPRPTVGRVPAGRGVRSQGSGDQTATGPWLAAPATAHPPVQRSAAASPPARTLEPSVPSVTSSDRRRPTA